MGTVNSIPFLTTDDLWKNHAKSVGSLSQHFPGQPDEFLIVRLEDIAHFTTSSIPPHRRDVHEIIFITNGEIVRGANLNSIVLKGKQMKQNRRQESFGDIHILLANQISAHSPISKNIRGYYCQFSSETIIKLYHKEHMVNELAYLNKQMMSAPIRLEGKAYTNVISIFERLIDEYQTQNDLSLIDAYLVTLCYEIKQVCLTNESGSTTAKAYHQVEEYKQLLTHYIHTERSVAFYAEHLHITPNHLNKSVKQVTGKSASSLIADMIILEAKVLLQHTLHTVAEISYKLGFEDQSYFGRYFKLHSGQTPLGYRQQVLDATKNTKND
jgi:AraC family transcriptional regulator, transcriptional activator of pobA